MESLINFILQQDFLYHYPIVTAVSEHEMMITFREEPVSVLNDGFNHCDYMYRGGCCYLSKGSAKQVCKIKVLPLGYL